MVTDIDRASVVSACYTSRHELTTVLYATNVVCAGTIIARGPPTVLGSTTIGSFLCSSFGSASVPVSVPLSLFQDSWRLSISWRPGSSPRQVSGACLSSTYSLLAPLWPSLWEDWRRFMSISSGVARQPLNSASTAIRQRSIDE